MQKIKFAYNEPRIGDIEIEGKHQGIELSLSEEDILRLIEDQYPEAIDVEIIESEEIF